MYHPACCSNRRARAVQYDPSGLGNVFDTLFSAGRSVVNAVVGRPTPSLRPPTPSTPTSTFSLREIARRAAEAAAAATRAQIADTAAAQGGQTQLGRDIAARSIPQLPAWVAPVALVGGAVLLSQLAGGRRR